MPELRHLLVETAGCQRFPGFSISTNAVVTRQILRRLIGGSVLSSAVPVVGLRVELAGGCVHGAIAGKVLR